MWYSLVHREKIAEDGEKACVGDDDDVIMILFWNMKQLSFEDDGDFSLEPCLQREREGNAGCWLGLVWEVVASELDYFLVEKRILCICYYILCC